jgi:hypothetical protein
VTREDGLERSEVEAALETRRELGPGYEREVVDAFAERIERAVEQRVAAEVQHRDRAGRRAGEGSVRQFVLGIVSLGVGVPVTIVPMVATDGGLPAVVVAWLGIAGVNAAHAAALNGPRQRP